MSKTLIEFRRGHVEVHTSGSQKELDDRFEQLTNDFDATRVSGEDLKDSDLEFLDELEPEETLVFGILEGNFEFNALLDEGFDCLRCQWVKMSYC